MSLRASKVSSTRRAMPENIWYRNIIQPHVDATYVLLVHKYMHDVLKCEDRA